MNQRQVSRRLKSDIDETVSAYQSMRSFLTSFLDHTLRDMDYEVRDKVFFENLFDMEFQEAVENAVLYNDIKASFTDILFYGKEFMLMSFEILLIAIVDYISQNFVLAVIITYLIQNLFIFFRFYLSKSNLARKTLVDERFLI